MLFLRRAQESQQTWRPGGSLYQLCPHPTPILCSHLALCPLNARVSHTHGFPILVQRPKDMLADCIGMTHNG